MPFENRLPIFNFLTIELVFPFFRRKGALGAEVVLFVTSGAAVALDVVEELTLGVVGDLPPFDRAGSGRLRPEGKALGFSRAGRKLRTVFWRDWS